MVFVIQVRDICYWMNATLEEKQREKEKGKDGERGCFCLNTAIEATTLTARVGGWEVLSLSLSLLPFLSFPFSLSLSLSLSPSLPLSLFSLSSSPFSSSFAFSSLFS